MPFEPPGGHRRKARRNKRHGEVARHRVRQRRQRLASTSPTTPASAACSTVHHVWGAYLYDTPWRLHIVFIGVPTAAVFVALLAYAAGRHGTGPGRIAAWFAVIIIVVFCSLLLGLYEGGYNHVLKNLVYFTHGPVRWMFPDGVTGIPDDLLFEATGMAHLPAGILAALAGRTVLRDLKR